MERLTFLNGDDVPCVKGVNGEDRPESGQMTGRCGIVQRDGGKGLWW